MQTDRGARLHTDHDLYWIATYRPRLPVGVTGQRRNPMIIAIRAIPAPLRLLALFLLTALAVAITMASMRHGGPVHTGAIHYYG